MPLSTSSLVSSARTLLARRPLVTNCATYGLLYSGSEWLQQTILRYTEPGAGHQYDLGTIARWVMGILYISLNDSKEVVTLMKGYEDPNIIWETWVQM